MLVETTWIHPSGEDPYFQTQTTAADILAAHKAGKNVVIHFPADENTQQFYFDCSLYTILTMYQQECAGSLHNETPREEKFFVAGGETSVGRYNLVGYGTILENGYVKFSIITDSQMA